LLNVTLPVGVAPPATVAVNVTDWPSGMGLADVVSAVVVGVRPTDCTNVADALVVKFVSPAYVAMTSWLPEVSWVVEISATPDPLTATLPIEVPSTVKSTFPVGVPAPGAVAVTVAVKVTLAATALGLGDETSAVEELAWLTTWLSAAEVPAPTFVSPA